MKKCFTINQMRKRENFIDIRKVQFVKTYF